SQGLVASSNTVNDGSSRHAARPLPRLTHGLLTRGSSSTRSHARGENPCYVRRHSRLKLDRVQVGIIQFEAEPDRAAAEGTDVAAGLPDDGAVDRVAEQVVAVGEGKTFDRGAVGLLQLHADAPRRRRREVELQ